MRECLIKLYCTIGELQTQRENSETGKLRKQLDDMKKRVEEIQEKNRSLRRELKIVRNKVDAPVPSAPKKKDSSVRTPRSPVKGNKKDGKKEEGKERSLKNIKRNIQPVITPLERKGKNPRIRRELSFPSDNREPRNVEGENSCKCRKSEQKSGGD